MNEATVEWRIEDCAPPPTEPPPEYPARATDIEAYWRDGVVLLEGVFPNWVEPLRAGLERNLRHPRDYAFPCESAPPGAPGRFFDSYCNWQRIAQYRAFVYGSCAASMAGQFMRSASAQFFHEHAFVKEAGTQTATPWHQDLPYYCVDGQQNVSIYIALDEIAEDVAVRFVPGSHRWSELYFPREFLSGDNFDHCDPALAEVPDAEALEREHGTRAFALVPGDALLFHFRTLHGSGDAEVRRRRRAFSTRWLGDDMRYCARSGKTSPPYPDIGLATGERMREDWFPVLWRRAGGAA